MTFNKSGFALLKSLMLIVIRKLHWFLNAQWYYLDAVFFL